MNNSKPEPRKKGADQLDKPVQMDEDIFVLTNGPARTLWSMSSVIGTELVELMPIFDSEDQVLSLFEQLSEKGIQAAKTSLSKLEIIASKNNFRFLLNPKMIARANHAFSKRGQTGISPLSR